MPDNITPVGTQKNYDPMQGINMLSGVLGIQQQRLGLQQQQQQLQIGQGEAQKSQQAMHERQSVQQMLQSGKDDQGQSIIGEDGSPDPAKILPALGRMAPLTGQQVAQSILKTHSDKIGLQESARALDINHRNALQGMVQSVAAGMDPKEAISTMQDYAKQHPEAAATEKYMEGFVQHIGNAKDPETRAHLAQATASMMQPGQAVETRPQNASVQTATGSFQGAQAAPVAGGGFTPSTFTKRGIGPTEEPGYLAKSAAASASGGEGAKNDEALYNQITQAANRTGNIRSLTSEIEELAKEVKTGKYSKELADSWTALKQRIPGFQNVDLTNETRRQLLGKNAERLSIEMEIANGASTDAAQAHVRSAMPDPEHMTPDAIVDAARYVRGQSDMAAVRSQLATNHRQAQGGNSSQGLRALDTQFMSQSDPRDFAYRSLKPGAERQDYLRRHEDFRTQLQHKLLMQKTSQQ
jgi:hypothetical protein